MIDRTLPFVSVIVPVLNGEQTIRNCLLSLLRTDYPPDRREILVVDNGSTDDTAEIVKSLPVQYLCEKRRGISCARNRGIEASQGEIIAFTDADCVASSGWLRELVRGFEDDEVGGVEGETVGYPPVTPVEQHTARIGGYSHQRRLRSPLAPYVITANVAFCREVFRQIGLFDPSFPAGEDVDFSWRFFNMGELKLQYNPKAVIFHHHRSTVWELLSQQIRDGRGLAILQAKYPARLPWGWRQELQAWGVLGRLGWVAAQAAIRYGLRGDERINVYDYHFTFLRKLGIRLGFLWEMLATTTGKQKRAPDSSEKATFCKTNMVK